MSPKYNWFFKALVFFGRHTLCRYLRVQCHGLDHLPDHGRFILASNHRSTLDPVLVLLYSIPATKTIISPAATRGLFVGPLGWLLRSMASAEIDRQTRRNLANVRHLIKVLKARPILIFPEGGIVTPPERQEGHAGVALIASRTHVPVIPVALVDTHKSLPKGGRWIKRHRVTLRFGKPLAPDAKGKTDLNAFTREIMAAIEQLEAKGHEDF